MRLNPDVMSLDDGSVNSLSALDIILGIKAAETVVPTVPTPASSDTKLSAQATSVPQAAVPVDAQGTVNTNTPAGIETASKTNAPVVETTNTPEAISAATAKVVDVNGLSTDPANRLPGESASEANARITAAYKAQPKPELTQEGAAAGATIQWVRTGAVGVCKWMEVFPIGKPIPENRTTKYGNTYDSKGNLVSGTGLKTPTATSTNGKISVGVSADVLKYPGNPIIAAGGSPGGKDATGKEIFYKPEGNNNVGFYYADGSKVPTDNLVGSREVISFTNAGWSVQGLPNGVTPGAVKYANILKDAEARGQVVGSDAYMIGDVVVTRDFNGVSLYNNQGQLISGKGSQYQVGIAGNSATGMAQINIAAVGAYGTPEYNVNLAYTGSSTTNPLATNTLTKNPLTTTPVSGSSYGGSGSTSDPFTVDNKPFTGSLFGSTYNNGVVVDAAAKTADDIAKQGRLDARTEFSNTLKALGLPQNLVDELDNMIKQDYTKSQMYLELQKTPAWKERFPGMEALAAAGKAIDAGTYISQEKSMLQTLDYYGIDKKIFGTTAELGKQIGNLVSPKRFETVVALAAQDVEQNPDVLAELNMYYGVDKSAAISYLLNPTIGLDIIQRQARAAEIGAKAGKSKFDFGMAKEGAGVAESFINAAGTMDLQALDVAFQQARGLSDIQTSIAATEGASYNDLQAVSAILGKDQAAILDSQRRAARSVAKFSGGSGLGSGSLKRETTI